MVRASLSSLSKDAADLLREMVDKIPIEELRDYGTHVTGDGVPLVAEADGLRTISELIEKGWVRSQGAGIFSDNAYLTREAWDRYQIAEWSEVEEGILMEKRTTEFGSW